MQKNLLRFSAFIFLGDILSTKVCSKCKQLKDVIEFGNDASRPDKLRMKCKDCDASQNREWRKHHPHKTWAMATINSHKKKGFVVDISLQDLEVIARQHTHCPLCGVEFRWSLGDSGPVCNTSPTLDRVDNESRITPNNIMIICRRCNTTKFDRTFAEFVEYCKMITEKYYNVSEFTCQPQ